MVRVSLLCVICYWKCHTTLINAFRSDIRNLVSCIYIILALYWHNVCTQTKPYKQLQEPTTTATATTIGLHCSLRTFQFDNCPIKLIQHHNVYERNEWLLNFVQIDSCQLYFVCENPLIGCLYTMYLCFNEYVEPIDLQPRLHPYSQWHRHPPALEHIMCVSLCVSYTCIHSLHMWLINRNFIRLNRNDFQKQ